jgi:hypothetical protein
MILQSKRTGVSPLFDAPLFGANQGRSAPAKDTYEIDPIYNLAVKDERLTMYITFDMELDATETQGKRRV